MATRDAIDGEVRKMGGTDAVLAARVGNFFAASETAGAIEVTEQRVAARDVDGLTEYSIAFVRVVSRCETMSSALGSATRRNVAAWKAANR